MQETSMLREHEQRSVQLVTKWEQLHQVQQEYRYGVYALDLETTGLNPRKHKVITIVVVSAKTEQVLGLRVSNQHDLSTFDLCLFS